MTVIDTRCAGRRSPAARVATGFAVADVREYILRTLKSAT